MGEVRYSVNGKYFRDWNVFVSDSEGLFDALKRKKVNSYQWAEYNGQSVDLSSPKYEAREITLKCFVVGDNWVAMKANFDALVSEFQKSGTQRLLIEPFGLKPLPYEVYMEDSSPLEKRFREGKMVGVFSLKLIEPNPIKMVLYLTGNSLNLAYNSPKETEIFYGNGLKETASGNVSLSGKTLANRVVSGYAFSGRNLVLNSEFILDTTTPTTNYWLGMLKITDTIKQGESVVLSFDIQTVAGLSASYWFDSTAIGFTENFNSNYVSETKRVVKVLTAATDIPAGTEINIYNFSWASSEENRWNNRAKITKLKIEKGASATPYSAAPEEEKYIIIAGNVEEITDLTTNADVLWEKL